MTKENRTWGERLHFLLCWFNLHLMVTRKQSDKSPRRKECQVCRHTQELTALPKRIKKNADVLKTEPPTIDEMEVANVRPASEDLEIDEGRNE